jgi:cation diffusion facilitator family transporter
MTAAPTSERERRRDPRRIAITASLLVAVLMLVGKLTAYFITGSTAILSDALESVIHLFATAIAAFGLWYAAQPPDPNHPYGHGKIAYFASAVEGALIVLAAVGIVFIAVRDLVVGPELHQLGSGLLIIAVLASVNAVLGITLVRVGRKHNALVLVANGQHVLTDMWTSVGVIIGVGLVWLTDVLWLDPIVAIVVGLNILLTGGRLIQRSFHGLMERVEAADTEALVRVLSEALREGQVSGWHHLRHRRVNDRLWVEVHLLFPSAMSLTDAHRRATGIETRLRDLFPEDVVSITSHLEPESHEHEAAGHAHAHHHDDGRGPEGEDEFGSRPAISAHNGGTPGMVTGIVGGACATEECL